VKTSVLALLCISLLGCGSSPKPTSTQLQFLNGSTLATATSYWKGSCPVTFLNGDKIPQTIDLSFTADGGAESTVGGSTCSGTYSFSTSTPPWIGISTSCSESSDYVEGVQYPSGSTNSGSLEVMNGGVWEGSNLSFSGSNGEPCAFTLVQGKQP